MSDEHLLEMGGLLRQLIQQFASQGITPDEIERTATEIHEEQRQETAQAPNHSTLASRLASRLTGGWKTMEEKKRETDEMIVRLYACDFVIAWWQNHGGHLTGEEEVFEWRITN